MIPSEEELKENEPVKQESTEEKFGNTMNESSKASNAEATAPLTPTPATVAEEQNAAEKSDSAPAQAEPQAGETPKDNADAAEPAPNKSEETAVSAAGDTGEKTEENALADTAPQTEENTPDTGEAPKAGEDEIPATQEQEEEKKEYVMPDTKMGVISRLSELSHAEKAPEREEVEMLKRTYYRLRREEIEAQHKAYIDGGGKEEEYMPLPDTDEESFKAELSLVKEKRAKEFEALEAKKQENLKKKEAILDKIKELSTSPETANKNYEAFRALQAEWKECNPVPAENSSELWKNYQHDVENFYDMLKLNNEFREYDFKKNLEAKTHIIECVEKLAEEPDVISAFHQMQKFHQKFRETGPVAKDLREQIWNRFKAATTVINKRHQEYFEKLRAQENENLEKKTALCEKVEAMDYSGLKTFAEWNKMSDDIKAIQAEWKTIGFTPKSMNVQIFERFRKSCDAFFNAKSEYFKAVKDSFSANLEKKKALCEKAEALSGSQEWGKTAQAIRDLQKEWKEAGPVARKDSDAIWKRFNTACNAFFDAKKKATSSLRQSEKENLATKRSLIEELKAITKDAGEEGVKKVREIMDKWQETGHVPYKVKEDIFQAYHKEIDRLYSELDIRHIARRAEDFKAQAVKTARKGGDALYSARQRLFAQYEAKKNEIQTYENNLGFLNVSSKSGGSFVNEIKKRISSLKADLEALRRSIEEMDAKAREEQSEKNSDTADKGAAPAKGGDGSADAEADAPKGQDKN